MASAGDVRMNAEPGMAAPLEEEEEASVAEDASDRASEIDGDEENGLVVKWSRLKLQNLKISWIAEISQSLVEMDLSQNLLEELPPLVPWGLKMLRTFDASSNQLTCFPSVTPQQIFCTGLTEINLSMNCIFSLPAEVFLLTNLKTLNLSHNQLSEFGCPERAALGLVQCRDLEVLNLSYNQLGGLRKEVLQLLNGLRCLNVSHNQLKAFPPAWHCPLVQLKATHNQLEEIGESFQLHWESTLQELDLSNNALAELPAAILQLTELQSLNLSDNHLLVIPPARMWTCCKLQTLDLSQNYIGKQPSLFSRGSGSGGSGSRNRLVAFITRKLRHPTEGVLLDLPDFLGSTLEALNLSSNFLDSVPSSIGSLLALQELYLSRNPGVRELPHALGSLGNLWLLEIDELEISNVPAHLLRDPNGTPAILAYLRAQQRRSQHCYSLKLMVVGPSHQGKTSLLSSLRHRRKPPPPPVSGGYPDMPIVLSTWDLQRPLGLADLKVEKIRFSVWDVGGTASALPVHRCLCTDRALYLLVWNLALGEEGVLSLHHWLLTIQARAPHAAVIVVGTHLDRLPERFMGERLATLKAHVLSLCCDPSGRSLSGYPSVDCKHICEVSCQSLAGIDDLRKLIFRAACGIKDGGSAVPNQRLLGRLVPRSYIALHDAVQAERQRRVAEVLPQVLTREELRALAESTPGNDFSYSHDDLQRAVQFLSEVGALLHFPDCSWGLGEVLFLHGGWLAHCLEGTLRGVGSGPGQGATRPREAIVSALAAAGVPARHQEQLLQLLLLFEMMLPLQHDSFLLPHLMPERPGLQLLPVLEDDGKKTMTVRRLVQMSFTPVGFWSRLIARLLISVAQIERQVVGGVRRPLGKQATDPDCDVSYARASTFRIRRARKVYWHEGLAILHSDGFFSVEAAGKQWGDPGEHPGIEILVQSQSQDFSAIAFVTDHVNTLIEHWFPELMDVETNGTPFIKQLIPCPYCAGPADSREGERQGGECEDDRPGLFTLEECVMEAVRSDVIACHRHVDNPVPLTRLIPEAFLTDFPKRLLLDVASLDYDPREELQLGQGASGTIYRALYQGQPVAVKDYHIKGAAQQEDTVLRRMHAGRVWRRMADLRVEACMMRTLSHPCVVALLGVSVRPLVLVLELAPLGSLSDVLERREALARSQEEPDADPLPLGVILTHKVIHQMGLALAYLHRHGMLHCDLKSDNVLVWSLDPRVAVNAKLADYGVSRLSFGQGSRGSEGTPGYQAPEVRPGFVFDERVDVFSLGMVIYELLSGQRPTVEGRPLDVVRKLIRGERPTVPLEAWRHAQPLAEIMEHCWKTCPKQRPSSHEVVTSLCDPTSACQAYSVECGQHDACLPCIAFPQHALLWYGDGILRRYSVLTVPSGHMQTKHLPCPGGKVVCLTKVGSTVWIATQDLKIEIYVLREMCPLCVPDRIIPVPSQVTCLLTIPSQTPDEYDVLAGLEDGNVAVFLNKPSSPSLEPTLYLCPAYANLHVFGVSEWDSRQAVTAVRAIVSVRDGKELWFGNGPAVVIAEREGFRIARRLEMFSAVTVPPSRVAALAVTSSSRGSDPAASAETVWALDDVSNALVACDAESYSLLARYPLNASVARGDALSLAGYAARARTREERRRLHITPVGKGLKIFVDGSSDDEESQAADGRHERAPESPSLGDNKGDSVEQQRGAELGRETLDDLCAVDLISVRDCLWVPRRGGDILVIHVNREEARARVIAVMKGKVPGHYRKIVSAGPAGDDAIVCCHGDGAGQLAVSVWRKWLTADFTDFYSFQDNLRSLIRQSKFSR
ncbi:leucine-rich repeat serine/threonine-protein kinase 1 isoform X1 [Lethenteron reissneri]|uniref:leucine-rich repeat serine/threonine-protein kinase 1 isoform X1 n=1 Tax=Lethenteron reissneri TaxID=7753 RepID=UPI002AB65266|nr:leucine-rich repeat serine/threonine-protein kinase 1 isoform X1 [Lethenteron reissneri]XP_061408693.1 leucine-rich repeat serine/threonine-protein kinase 1 isoform X1 [Lethenteron reissneri]